MSFTPLALVIEGDAGTRRLLDVLLTRSGFAVDVVANGADAIQLLQHVAYDLVTLDLMVPAVSGSDVLLWLATTQAATLDRTLVLSSAPETTLQHARRRWPHVRMFRKPFEVEEVVQAMCALRPNASSRELSPAASFCRSSILAGAKAGVVVRARGTTLEPMLTFGYTPEQIAPLLSMSIDDPYPLCKVLREGQPLWCGSTMRDHPELPMLSPVWSANESRAYAVVPLVRDGSVVGVAGWTYREPRPFVDAERRLLAAIAANALALLTTGERRVMIVDKPA